jgi:hypothetical protein
VNAVATESSAVLCERVTEAEIQNTDLFNITVAGAIIVLQRLAKRKVQHRENQGSPLDTNLSQFHQPPVLTTHHTVHF